MCRIIVENTFKMQSTLYLVYVDFAKDFNTTKKTVISIELRKRVVDNEYIHLIEYCA